MHKRERRDRSFPPDEAALLRDFERYRRLVDDWTRKFGLEQPGCPRPDHDKEYIFEPAFHYEVHGT